MSRGPTRSRDSVIEQVMEGECPLCHLPREQHHQITVHVCYSDKVIRHWMCPESARDRRTGGS